MLNDIIAAISLQLHKTFGDDCDIYTSAVQQGQGDRCFYIWLISTLQETLQGRRKYRAYPFDVVYVSDLGENDLHAAAEMLYDNMEIITTPEGDKLLGTNMRTEIEDGILHFKVNYNMIVYTADTDDSEKMEIAKITVKG